MARECLWLAIVALCPGCSLILDFSQKAVPADASVDAPYSADQCAFDEPNDSFDTAMPVTATDTGPAAICATDPDAGTAEDHDFYKFTVPMGTTTTSVTITFTNRPGGDLDLRLYDAMQSVIAQSRGFGDGEQLICPGDAPCPTLAPGDYVFEVFPATSGAVNSYTFAVTTQ